MVDRYARNKGTTLGEMRAARNLDKVAPPTDIDAPGIVDAFEKRARSVRELSDAFAVLALDHNADMQRCASSLGLVVMKLFLPNPVDAPTVGYEADGQYFGKI